MSSYLSKDTALVCLNGHVISGSMRHQSHCNSEYCSICGEKTIFSCPECNSKIEGATIRTSEDFWEPQPQHSIFRYLKNPPKHCSGCGKPYPWTQSKIKAAIQIFAEFGDLENAEKETIEQDIQNIAKDNPTSELSAMRVKKIWSRGKKYAEEIMIEIASRTAAKILSDNS